LTIGLQLRKENTMEWNEDQVLSLTSLWKKGITTAKIAAELGTTIGSITGKTRRLGLPRRPSPIKSYRRYVKRSKNAITMLHLKDDDCRYPYNTPGDNDFHFCAKKIKPGSVYCSEHHQLCYSDKETRRMSKASSIRYFQR
jgi:GcrA cell cycle regulator